MKRVLIIIGVLAVIFVGMMAYKTIIIKANNKNVNIQEIQKIEEYITSIYMWKEITTEALPKFENVDNADELWVWEVVKNNFEEYPVTYEEIQDKAKEIFGENFSKEFKKEGTESLKYNAESDNYYATEIVLDELEDSFLLNNIEKTNDGYVVEIMEYLEDYSQENIAIIRNLQNEEILRVDINESETTIKENIKNNIERFTKKTIYLRKQDDRVFVEKIV